MRGLKRYFSLLLMLEMIVLSPVAMADSPLSPFLWKHRVLLVNAPDSHSKMQARLEAAEEYVAERDVVWFVLNSDDYASNLDVSVPGTFSDDLKRKYFPKGKYHVVLVGKDGGVKRRSEALDLAELFGLIDSMPMRRREMGE
ncbi:MAG: DUF4174 domain-containing protein [Gammaproteobacteria bacterium]